jgi:putative membrane protein
MTYNFLKSLHIIFFTTWMAGLFYLPRIFVYHSISKKKSKEYNTFVTMERKLLNYIMNPSLFLSWILGLSLVVINEYYSVWLLMKFFLVILMTIFHIYCAKVRRDFERGVNYKNQKYFRLINEIPTVLFILIVFLVVFKPFN